MCIWTGDSPCLRYSNLNYHTRYVDYGRNYNTSGTEASEWVGKRSFALLVDGFLFRTAIAALSQWVSLEDAIDLNR